MPARVPFSARESIDRTAHSAPVGVAQGETAVLSPDALISVHREHGDAFAFSHKSSLHYFFSRPAAVNDVLLHKEESFCQGDSAAAFSAVVGWGLLGDHGESHRVQKRAISPALRGAALEAYTGKTQEIARALISTAQNAGPIPLVDWCRNFAQAVSEKVLFPTENHDPDYAYQRSVLALNEMVQVGNFAEAASGATSRDLRRFIEHRDLVIDYVNTMVEAWRSREPGDVTLMDFMIEPDDGEWASTSSLQAQVAVFLQAAMETTASLLSWSLMWLERKPHYWDLLRQQTASVSAIDVLRNPAPKSFIDEVLRLNPPAWFISRVALEPVEIDNEVIPRGARVVIAPWISHRSSRFFSEPEEFRPERWLDDTEPDVPRGVFVPFGLGSRICVGERFARLTATILLSEIAALERAPRVELGDGALGTWGLVTNPRQSVTLDFS